MKIFPNQKSSIENSTIIVLGEIRNESIGYFKATFGYA